MAEKFHFGLALSISSNEKTGGASGGATGVGGSAALARIRRHDLLFLCWTTGSTKGWERLGILEIALVELRAFF